MNKELLERGQELAFAVIRIAGSIRRSALRMHIEKNTYEFIESISQNNGEIAVFKISGIISLLTLGKNLYEIETRNFSILDSEFKNLEEKIRKEYGIFPETDISQLISKKVPIKSSSKSKKIPEISQELSEIVVESTDLENDVSDIEDPEEAISASERQERMISMLSDEKRLQLKDFIAVFPDVSERTLRYDLKSLFEGGKIERQGVGGPGSFYVLKEG